MAKERAVSSNWRRKKGGVSESFSASFTLEGGCRG